MKRIGLLSDTHGFLYEGIFNFFSDCDEIWHAGDWGCIKIYEELSAFKPVRGVYGNIDISNIRNIFPRFISFKIEHVNVLMTHIGGYPGKYDKNIVNEIVEKTPNLFICGHSHILKIIFDKKYKMLCVNPGAAGKYGIHIICTAVRFRINEDSIENLEVLEYER